MKVVKVRKMSVRNRSSYSSRQSERSRAWGLLRGAGILLLLAILSFALGFFVLARIMPGDKATETPGNTAPSQSSNGSVPSRSENAPSASTGIANASPAPREDRPGPVIDPEGEPEVQQPESLDEPRGEASDDDDGEENREERPATENNSPPQIPEPSRNEPFGAVVPEREPDRRSSEETPRRNRERDDVQPPARLDSTQSTRTTPSSTAAREREPSASAPQTSSPTNSGLFRVQVGAYSTKEAAEREAQRLTGQGFSANVQAMNSGGRTLYRVQHGAFRNKANAESARERLKAAGVDSTLSQSE